MRADDQRRQRTLEDYVGIITRRKWIVILPVLIVPIAAYLYSVQQPASYAASSEVLLSRQDLGSRLAGSTNADIYTDPDRFAQTQAALARVPEVARRAAAAANVGVDGDTLLAASSVRPQGNADLLGFTVQDGDPLVAAKLAAAYAAEFSQYRLELDTASLANARADLQRSLRVLRRQDATGTQLYDELSQKAQELRTMELLQTKPKVVRTPTLGSQVAPTPRRSAMLGAAIGLLLGLTAAFLWDALDKRVREEDEIADALGLPIVARVPTGRPGTDANGELPMLNDPGAFEAEAYRRLRSNIEFANLDVNARAIMITSATGGEGKSRTIANLALAFALSGRRVALVDLDLRRPTIGRYFGFGLRPGITDVAIERVDLEQGLVKVPLPSQEVFPALWERSPRSIKSVLSSSGDANPAPDQISSQHEATGELYVLPAGFPPANPGEFVGTQAVAAILDDLKARMEVVLVDAPPLLPVSDAATVSTQVDAILVVTRLGIVNRSTLRELTRQLESTWAHKLGIVVTGAEAPEQYGSYGRVPAPAPAGRSTLEPATLTAPPRSEEDVQVLGTQRRSARGRR